MYEFSLFYQILLNLFDILNSFYDNIELILKRKYVKRCKQFKYYHEMHLKCQISLTKID